MKSRNIGARSRDVRPWHLRTAVAGVLLGGAVGVVQACGSSDSSNGFESDGGAGKDATTGTSDGASDGAFDAVSLGDAGAGHDAIAPGDGAPGACSSCGSGQLCVDGGCACPVYQSLCDGGCIATSGDPDNCGGCGVTCTAEELCSSNACVPADAGCQAGLLACGRECVDPGTDNNHCGGCSTVCGPGMGCAGRSCVANYVGDGGTDGGPGNCAGGGPPIIVDGDAGCTGSMAQVTFRWALCSCTQLDVSAPLTTDAYNSSQGPPDGGLGGSVGVDHAISGWSSNVSVGGDMWASDAGEFAPSAPSEVRHDLYLGGDIHASATFKVDHDALVTGTLSGVTVTGTTAHPASIPAPCDCAPQQIIPVAAIVAAHAPPNDDNATIGLDPDAVAHGPTPLRIDLPCGSYYLSSISADNPLAIVAHGHTALFIGGDVSASSALAFQLDPTATLDIFIAGSIHTSAALTIGSPNYPVLCRTYVGGTADLPLSADVDLGCNLYAASSMLVDWSSSNAVYGSVFAGDFKASAPTTIHFDRAVESASQECAPPAPDAGPPVCMSCRDCNNQACNSGTCGACATSSDCCAPLMCVAGVCIPLD